VRVILAQQERAALQIFLRGTPEMEAKTRKAETRIHAVREVPQAMRQILERATDEILEQTVAGDPDRLESKLVWEKALWRNGFLRPAGIDEAGRGPLAGPVVAAAVILSCDGDLGVLRRVDDSKRLSPALREKLSGLIMKCALAYGIGSATEREVDSLNIRNASLLAMERAIGECGIDPDFLLIDGTAVLGIRSPQCAIIRGDQYSLSIAAASILAKVERDRIMVELGKRYPGYGFEKHKGYGTQEHRNAIRKLGPSPVHRVSFSFHSDGSEPM
jgi:ribonuclease HII